MSFTLSRDLSGSRDEALSSVHNQGFEVVTRSTTDIAASLTTNTLIDQSSEPLLSSTSLVFTGANIGSISGCTFQIFHGNVKIVQNERKRRIVMESDEDDWLWSYFLSTLSSFSHLHLTLNSSTFCNQENIVWSTKNPFSNFRSIKQLINRACSSRSGGYWPSVVAVRTSLRSVRTATTSG